MKKIIILLISVLALISCRKSVNPDTVNSTDLLASTQSADFPKPCSCTKPTGVIVNFVTGTSASISWTGPHCGTYVISYRPVGTNNWSYIHNVLPGLSYVINGLQPCTNYEVHISHTGNTCSSIWSNSAFFTTACTPCASTGINYYTNSILYLSFMEHSHPSIWVGNSPGTGYTDNTSITLALQPNFTYSMANGFCHNTGLGVGTMRWKLWIDYNNNSVFEASELVISKSLLNNWAISVQNCVDMALPSLTTPNANICSVRARFSVSYNQDQDPCSTINNGHVMDFKVKIGTCPGL